jgi:nucleoside-diphosphate-sugar epimerase
LNERQEQRTAWVTGASSQIGVFLLPRLRAAGYRVFAISRKAPREPLAVDPGVFWLRPEAALRPDVFPDPEDPGHVADLVSAGPLELASRLLGVRPSRRLVAFSTSSVHSKRRSADEKERTAVLEIAKAEAVLQSLSRSHGVPLLLLRPTLIYGCGRDRNVSLMARLGRRLRFIPVAGRAAGRRAPVHADDLAALTVTALESEPAADFESAACGGATLSYREMATAIADLPSVGARVLSMPPRLLTAAAGALSVLPRWRGIHAEMVRRQGRDLVFDDSALRERLDWAPRPFQPLESDFSVPEECLRLQLP